jgi:hypothetical protein
MNRVLANLIFQNQLGLTEAFLLTNIPCVSYNNNAEFRDDLLP